LFHILLGPDDDGVLMVFLTGKNNKGRLILPVKIDDEKLGGADGYFPVGIFLHQVKQQIPVSVIAAAGIADRNKPVKNAPTHKLAISAPFLYCCEIQGA